MATFTDVYKQELKGKGILSSLGSAALKRTRERLDPRNILFGGSGMIASTGQKIFGKGYQAIQRTAPTGQKLVDSGVMQTQALSSLIESSKSQEAILRIVAKNTSNNNAMARDINVMRQNIMKLVTMGGGKASRGADMFFKDAAAREASFESQFKRERPVGTAPTPLVKEEKKGSDYTGILKFLVPLLTIGKTIADTIKEVLGGIGNFLLEGLTKILSIENLTKALGFAKDAFLGIFRIASLIATNPLFLTLAGITSAGAALAYMRSDFDKRKEEYMDLAKRKKEGGLSPEEEKRLKELDTPVFRSDATQELKYDPIEGKETEAKTPGQVGAQNRRNLLRGPVSPAEFKYQQDMAERMSSYKTRAGTRAETSPTNVTTDSEGAFKSKDEFLTKMYPLAVKAAEKLGGIDPNALLTQWGFESAWGKKVSGKYNYFGIKADPSWKGEKKDVMTTEYLNGEKVNLPQPFRSYSSPEEAVDDYVNFLKTNKRYEKAGVFQSKTSGEFFSALQRAGYATDPKYAEKLTSATEGTGKRIAGLMESSSELRTAMSVQPAPNVIVNAPSSTTVASGGGRPQAVASATNIDAIELFAKTAVYGA